MDNLVPAAFLSFIGGVFLGGSIAFIIGYREGCRRTQDWFEEQLSKGAKWSKEDKGMIGGKNVS